MNAQTVRHPTARPARCVATMLRVTGRPLLQRRARARRAPPATVEFTVAGRDYALAVAPAASSPPAGSTRAPPCCCARPRCPRPTTAGAAARPRLRLRPDRLRAGHRGARGPTVYAVDVNARARELTARERRRRSALADRVRVAAPDDVPDDVRFAADLEQPADPRRQGRAARAAGALAAPAGAGRRRPGWWSTGTSAVTRCTPGWSSAAGRSSGTASQKGFRVLRVTRKTG